MCVGMYPHVAQAVNDGKVLLEWDYSKGQPTVPLVKDTYASGMLCPFNSSYRGFTSVTE